MWSPSPSRPSSCATPNNSTPSSIPDRLRRQPPTASSLRNRSRASSWSRKIKGKDRVHFVPVTTGITGSTDIEVTSGLKPGDRIVTGTYRILRDLKQNALVKQDTTLAAPHENDTSST